MNTRTTTCKQPEMHQDFANALPTCCDALRSESRSAISGHINQIRADIEAGTPMDPFYTVACGDAALRIMVRGPGAAEKELSVSAVTRLVKLSSPEWVLFVSKAWTVEGLSDEDSQLFVERRGSLKHHPKAVDSAYFVLETRQGMSCAIGEVLKAPPSKKRRKLATTTAWQSGKMSGLFAGVLNRSTAPLET